MFNVLTKGCEPTCESEFSAGIDLYASEDCIIAAGETKIIGLGVCIDYDFILSNIEDLQDEEYNTIECYSNGNWVEFFKMTHYLELHPRSSLRAKGLISNTGIIDLDYEDEIKIIIHNPIKEMYLDDITESWDEFGATCIEYPTTPKNNSSIFKIKKGDKIAQILLKEHKGYLLGVESDEKRVNEFGSTGE